MKNYLKISFSFLLFGACVWLLSSCQKMRQGSFTGVNTTVFGTYQAILLGGSGGGTIYAVNVCHRGDAADSVAFALLPDSAKSYLTATYAGYTFKKAYKIVTAAGVTEGYVVAITFNGNPVALKFNATGGFVAVLEQREGGDLNGPGWHEGGLFGDRDGRHRDTVALSALPTAVTAYMTSNYPGDTLKHALVNRDSSYVVISEDKGVFATEFSKTGTFIERVQIYPHVVGAITLTQATLPAAVSSYLTTTYPAYVFDNAFELTLNGSANGYLVFIDANSTKYLAVFNASGTFVRTIAIR
jgi:hypothetical protein